MVTALKRLFWLAVLGGAGFAGWSLWTASRRAPQSSSSTPAAAVSAGATAGGATDPPAVAALEWVAPVEGACPVSHPVKANDNSGIFHVPGGRFYERTKPERCYASPEAATADGYRAAKS